MLLTDWRHFPKENLLMDSGTSQTLSDFILWGAAPWTGGPNPTYR